MTEYVDNTAFEFSTATKSAMRTLRTAYNKAKTDLAKAESDMNVKKLKWKREKGINDIKADSGLTPDRTNETSYLDDYETAKTARVTKRAEITTAKNAIVNKIDEVEATIETITNEMSTVMDEISVKEDANSELEDQIKELKHDIKTVLAADLDSDIADLEDSIDENTEELTTNAQWIRDAKADLAKAKVTIDKYNAEINVAKNAIRPAVSPKVEKEEVKEEVKVEVKNDEVDDDSDDDDDDEHMVVNVCKPEPSLLDKVLDLLKPKETSCDNTKETLCMLLTAIQKQNNAVSHLVNNREMKKVNDMLDNALNLLKK